MFKSKYADLIWNELFTCCIPDILTLDDYYIKYRGVPITGDKKIDSTMVYNKTTVKIPIIKILEYFNNGVEIEIPSREDLLKIHRYIEAYLGEWKFHINNSINIDVTNYKEMLMQLERLSRYIYDKAKPEEVTTQFDIRDLFGIRAKLDEPANKPLEKPDYDSISRLIKKRFR